MYIYRVFDKDKSVDHDHYANLETAFDAAETELLKRYISNVTGYMITWYMNDEENWEAWIITKSKYDHQEFKAELLEFEVQRIEVF